MLHDADHTGGHEAGGAHRLAGPGDLGHLHDAPSGGHLDSPARLGGSHLELAHAAADVHEDLDPITLHGKSVGPEVKEGVDGSTRAAGSTAHRSLHVDVGGFRGETRR